MVNRALFDRFLGSMDSYTLAPTNAVTTADEAWWFLLLLSGYGNIICSSSLEIFLLLPAVGSPLFRDITYFCVFAFLVVFCRMPLSPLIHSNRNNDCVSVLYASLVALSLIFSHLVLCYIYAWLTTLKFWFNVYASSIDGLIAVTLVGSYKITIQYQYLFHHTRVWRGVAFIEFSSRFFNKT